MNVYAFITPIVVALLLFEIIYSIRVKNGIYNFQDTITNLGTGIGNQCINLAVAFFVYKWYGWLYQFAPWQVPTTWYSMIGLLIISDFVFYWFHRTGHRVNVFWAAHMPHHSSEEMNLSVGVRASFTQRIFQFAFFDWVLVLSRLDFLLPLITRLWPMLAIGNNLAKPSLNSQRYSNWFL